MMDYELFKQLVPQRILDFMPPVFRSYEPTVRPVEKVNETKDSFYLMPPGKPANTAIPTLYLDELYEHFREHQDMDEILRRSADVFMKWSGVDIPGLSQFRLEEHTDRIVANLISTDKNRALLQKVPHVEYMGMSVIYRLIHTIDEESINSAIITFDMLQETGLTPEDLQEHAKINSRILFPFHILDEADNRVCIVTNEAGYFGATSMLYTEEMQNLALRMGGDFFILPTSVHEFFAIAVDHADPDNLMHMLAEGNASITRSSDQLSDSVYRFLSEEERIVRVTSQALLH